MRATAPNVAPPSAADDTKTNAVPLPRLARGALVAGRYRIAGVMGVGGMGVVYRARDEELGVDVALKVLQADLAHRPEWIERFRRELLLAREVTHKNVVRIHDIGESDGVVFLSMRLVEGRSLLEVLEKEGPFPLSRALHVARQVAAGLQEAHQAGVVHRDLKPGNVLLGADDTAYITDFGVARWLYRDGVTRSGVVVGTLDYLSPEQAAGGQVDARTDVYALGILLFEMLTGQLPFRADSKAEALAQRIAGRTRDISETGAQVPAFVRHAIRRCLERAPARRYANTGELIADLDARRAGWDRLSRPAWRALLLLPLVLVPVAWWRWKATHEPPPPVAAPAPVPAPVAVAILPLSDETGDPSLAWTATGVAEMLAVQLAEASGLRVVDSARVQRTLRDLGLQGGVHDEAELRRLAELYDAGRLVTGSVRRAGGTVRVDLRLVSVGASGRLETRPIGAETPEAGGLFRVVAELAGRLRESLGAGALAAAAPDTSHAVPLEAARAYREGRQRTSVGDPAGAAQAFERAVEADPEFTAGLLALSEAYRSLGQRDKAVAAAERAAGTAGAAETRLGLRARAHLALLHGDPAAAESAFGELVRRFPNDTEALVDLAGAQAAQGRAADAVVSLKKVTELDRGDARAWLLLGRNMILAGDVRRAVSDPLVRALALMTQLGNEQGRGDVLNAMGVGHQRLGEYAQAVATYREAADLRRKIGDERGMAISLKNRASVHIATGHFAEAEPDLAVARSALAKIGDQKGLADVWNEIGALHEGRGEYTAARQAYREALGIRRELGDQQQVAQSYDNLGYGFFLEGEYDNALVYWQQALDLRRKIGDRSGIVLSTQNLGFLQTARGRFPEAMRSFLDALEAGREMGFTHALAVSQGNIGLLQQYEGRYDAALRAYETALATLTSLDDRRGQAEFSIKEAQALTEVGRWEEARTRLDAAAAWVQATGNREQAADQQAALGDLSLEQGDAQAAAEAFGRAVEHARASGARAAILRATIGHGAARVAKGEGSGAQLEIRAALREAEALGDAVLRIRAAEALAGAQLQLGKLGPAEEAVRGALAVAERCGFESGLYRLWATLGRIQERRGNAVSAAAAYRDSAARVARLRSALPAEWRSAFDRVKAVREVEAWVAAHPAVAAR